MGATANILSLYFNILSLCYKANRCERVHFFSLIFWPFILVSFPYCTRSAHEIKMECTRMPVIVKLPSGNWRAQVRRKGKYISNTFRRRSDADTWALETERTIDKGLDPKIINPRSVQTFSDIIDLHIQDMQEVGKTIRRSKSAVLEALKLTLGGYRLQEITRSVLIDYGKKRAKQGAGPATLAIDLSFNRHGA